MVAGNAQTTNADDLPSFSFDDVDRLPWPSASEAPPMTDTDLFGMARRWPVTTESNSGSRHTAKTRLTDDSSTTENSFTADDKLSHKGSTPASELSADYLEGCISPATLPLSSTSSSSVWTVVKDGSLSLVAPLASDEDGELEQPMPSDSLASDKSWASELSADYLEGCISPATLPLSSTSSTSVWSVVKDGSVAPLASAEDDELEQPATLATSIRSVDELSNKSWASELTIDYLEGCISPVTLSLSSTSFSSVWSVVKDGSITSVAPLASDEDGELEQPEPLPFDIDEASTSLSAEDDELEQPLLLQQLTAATSANSVHA